MFLNKNSISHHVCHIRETSRTLHTYKYTQTIRLYIGMQVYMGRSIGSHELPNVRALQFSRSRWRAGRMRETRQEICVNLKVLDEFPMRGDLSPHPSCAGVRLHPGKYTRGRGGRANVRRHVEEPKSTSSSSSLNRWKIHSLWRRRSNLHSFLFFGVPPPPPPPPPPPATPQEHPLLCRYVCI